MLLKILLLLFPLAVSAKVSDTASPKELLTEMAKLQKVFAAHKSADSDQMAAHFPEAMRLLSLAQHIPEKEMPARMRIEAMLKLAVASVPFDDSLPAGEVLATDYAADEHAAVYEQVFKALPETPARNRLQISIEGNAKTLGELRKDDENARKAPAPVNDLASPTSAH